MMEKHLKSQRPGSSIASKSSGRVSHQSSLRPGDIRAFQRETIMTPSGFKTVKIYTGSDESTSCMNKYQQRPRTAIGIEESGDINQMNNSKNKRLLQRAASANGFYKNQSKESNEKPDKTASSKPNTPPSQRPVSRQTIYNTRHPSCKPSSLYTKKELPSYAKKHRQRSKSQPACEECSSAERYNTIKRRRAKSSDVAYRFGVPVQCPNFVKGNPFLMHNGLDAGQKQYIWGMAKVYSVDTIKSLRQRHYQSILNHEYMKRISTRSLEKADRIKVWKDFLAYQKVINRFGENDPKPPIPMMPHSHAKKHEIVGWTTEVTDDNYQDSSSSADSSSNAEPALDDVNTSLNDDSLIYTDDGTGTDNGSAWEAQEKPLLKSDSLKERPKSPKYRIRKPLSPATPGEKTETEMQDINVDETLSGELADKLSIGSDDQNFI